MAIGLVTVALAATVAAVVSTTRTEVHRQAEAQLESAAATARRMLEFRGSQLAAGARALSADFGLKAAVANGDGPTLRSALGNHGRRIGASLMVLYDADGRRLAGSGQQPSPSAAAQLGAVIAAGGDVRERQRFELIDGVPYQLVYAPVRAPDLIAWTVIGFTLDDAVAADMARVLGVEVSFVSRSSAGPVYVASSWQGTQRASVVGSAAARAGQPVTLEYAGEELLTRTEPAPTSDGWLTLVLQRSMSAALRPYAELRNAVVLIGATTLLAALGLGVWLARSALKPVELLTEAAQRLEAGDYSAEVPASSTRELSKLAAAFNAMRSAVRQREAQILHQAHYDALTGLPNRSSAARILARMIGEAGPESGHLAVLRIALNAAASFDSSRVELAGTSAL